MLEERIKNFSRIMKNTLFKILVILLTLVMLAGCLAACDTATGEQNTGNSKDNSTETSTETSSSDFSSETEAEGTEPNTDVKDDELPEFVDYASQIKLDKNSGRKWAEVTVHAYIDGDTTHFNINDPDFDGAILKARYLGINTPESTGSIEPWGKKASNYTETQLKSATSIIIESDSGKWDADSTGGRYLVWVWYKTAEDTDYRNLNMEILQQGLAFGSNASQNSYSDYAIPCLAQAKLYKLHVFSKEDDPDFYYGGAIELSLKEIKANCKKYEDKLVKFEAVVAKSSGATFYVEEYDAENDMYFGMQIFAGYNCSIIDDFQIGTRVIIVGKLSYYKNGGTYQVSDLKYDIMDREWAGGCQVLGTGESASYRELGVDTLMNGKITLDTYIETQDPTTGEITESLERRDFDYGELAHYSTATMKNLTVKRVYTTDSDTDSDGALTITCVDADGNEIKLRTASKLTQQIDGKKVEVTADDFPIGTVISSVKGIIDSFNGEYQLKVFSFKDFVIAE